MASDAGTLMRDFIAAPDADSELLLTELLATHAGPHVRRIVTQRLSAAGVSEYQDIDDLCGDVLTELLYRLRQIKENPGLNAIDNIYSYAAAASYRAYSDYLRRKYPQRHRLKTQLRYLLQTDKRFDLWQLPDYQWMCRLSRWDHAIDQLRKSPTVEELSTLSAKIHIGRRPDHPGDFVMDLLNRLGAPVELNDLVGIVADLWGIRDRGGVEIEERMLSVLASKLTRLQQDFVRHLTDEELAAWTDAAEMADPAFVEAHLGRCASCRQELADLHAFQQKLEPS
jgi:hypothetical protein